MNRFQISGTPIEPQTLQDGMRDGSCGALVVFEGWVRDHHEGRDVRALEYEAYEAMAVKEGERVLEEAIRNFELPHACAVHRVGKLDIGDLAIWVGVSTGHRANAFEACRFIIDEIKGRVPIWKKEHYANGDSGWVNCDCAAAATTSPSATAR